MGSEELFFLAVFVVLSAIMIAAYKLAGASGRKRAVLEWERRWLGTAAAEDDFMSSLGAGAKSRTRAVASIDADSQHINPISGTWSGTFLYNSVEKSSVGESDGQFMLELSQNGESLAGHITDSLGEASVRGVLKYPHIRLVKTYESSKNARWHVGAHLGTIYYEGRVSADCESMKGEWFQFPFDRKAYAGSWRTSIRVRTIAGTVLVPRRLKHTVSHDHINISGDCRSESESLLELQAEDETISIPVESAIGDSVPVASGDGRLTESVVCSHCQEHTPINYDFCLLCSQPRV